MMFRLFRYGLIPVALFCVVIVAAFFDTYAGNIAQKRNWPQTVATVVEAHDAGDALAEFRGAANSFPDPYGSLRYAAAGQTYTWQGRGRDIGVTRLTPGEQITLRYNPADPKEINTLVLLGAGTGSTIFAFAVTFLALYLWFFWLRGRFGGGGGTPQEEREEREYAPANGGWRRGMDQRIERMRLTGAAGISVSSSVAAGGASGTLPTFGKR